MATEKYFVFVVEKAESRFYAATFLCLRTKN